jgi:hypothetical protein
MSTKYFFKISIWCAALGKPRRRWEDNNKMDLHGEGCGDMDRIALTHDRDRWWALVNAVMNLPVPYTAGSFLTS